MPNQFKDWARMYGANKQYLESQGRPSSFFGQIGDIPNRIHEAADATEIGTKMMRHSALASGAGLRATVTVDLQVEATPGSDPALVGATVAAEPTITATEPLAYGSTTGFSAHA